MTKNMVKYLNRLGIYDVGGLKHVLGLSGKKSDVKKNRNNVLTSALNYYNSVKPEVENKKKNEKKNKNSRKNKTRNKKSKSGSGVYSDGKFHLVPPKSTSHKKSNEFHLDPRK